MKAMQRSDFRFFDAQGNVITDLINNRDRVVSVEITWRVQKNRQNGQKITWVANEAFPLLCPVQAALRIATRSIRLGLSESGVPLGCYIKTSAKKNKVVYITGNVISDVLRALLRMYTHTSRIASSANTQPTCCEYLPVSCYSKPTKPTITLRCGFDGQANHTRYICVIPRFWPANTSTLPTFPQTPCHCSSPN